MESNVFIHCRCDRRICSSKPQVLDRHTQLVRRSGKEVDVFRRKEPPAGPSQSECPNHGLLAEHWHQHDVIQSFSSFNCWFSGGAMPLIFKTMGVPLLENLLQGVIQPNLSNGTNEFWRNPNVLRDHHPVAFQYSEPCGLGAHQRLAALQARSASSARVAGPVRCSLSSYLRPPSASCALWSRQKP